MPDPLAQTRYDLALANRILAHEGVVDAFGHVSVRHPTNPERYLISRHQACELVQPEDILELTLDSVPVTPTKERLYGELVIHGYIYKARPDVQAVCHHHADPILPYTVTTKPLVPVYHLGASLGEKVMMWDSRDEFGDTTLVVVTPEEGASLARALGPHWIVLLRRHGATVVGTTLREMVYRSIYTTRNAELQSRAEALGTVMPLDAGETAKCFEFNRTFRPTIRAWDYWTMRLAKTEALDALAMNALKASKPAPAKKAAPARRGKAAPAKRAKPAARKGKARRK